MDLADFFPDLGTNVAELVVRGLLGVDVSLTLQGLDQLEALLFDSIFHLMSPLSHSATIEYVALLPVLVDDLISDFALNF